MRLATIVTNDQEHVVIIDKDGKAFSLDHDEIVSRIGAKPEMLDLARLKPQQMRSFIDAAEMLVANNRLQTVAPDRWLPPIPRPGKVIGVALNNGAFAPVAFRYFEQPAFFMKSPSSLIGAGETIRVRESYGLTHPEPELACIIGKRLERATEDEVLASIFGYTIINDITSVGLKDQDSIHFELKAENAASPWRRVKSDQDGDIYLTYHLRSKCTDTFGPMGPWLVTFDEIGEPSNLRVQAWLGDRMIADDSTANLMFSMQKAISHLSDSMTLHPGDIVHLGTAIDPKSGYALRDADLLKFPIPVRIDIEKIGSLVNPVEVIK